MENESLEQRRQENDLNRYIKEPNNKEKEIWLQFAVAFSHNNSSGIVYTTDECMRGRTLTNIKNTIAKRADEMLKQYKERFYE